MIVLTGKSKPILRHDNPVPSPLLGRLNDYSVVGSTAHIDTALEVLSNHYMVKDIVYSPAKYRETEGIKD